MISSRVLSCAIVAGLWLMPGSAPRVLAAAPQADRDAAFDRILDTYVRDGLVYYRALKSERAPLDRYIGALNVPAATVAGWSKAAQEAFWINAYNAVVLRTVINDYPSGSRSAEFPPNSVRQVPGAFQRVQHQVGGESLTLDEIESKALAALGDPRAVFALGRGGLGSPRLRSEAYRAATLDAQLTDVVKECATRTTCFRVDANADHIVVTPIVGWNQALFEGAAPAASGPWANRSAVERSVLTLIAPALFPSERAQLAENHFQMTYGDFDWTLNDLTGR